MILSPYVMILAKSLMTIGFWDDHRNWLQSEIGKPLPEETYDPYSEDTADWKEPDLEGEFASLGQGNCGRRGSGDPKKNDNLPQRAEARRNWLLGDGRFLKQGMLERIPVEA
jgi:hypothetical protein